MVCDVAEMKKIEIILAFAVCALCFPASAQKLSFVYGIPELGKEIGSPQPVHLSGADTAEMTRQILPAARQHWRDLKLDCNEDFRIVGAAQGAFTRPGAEQTAVLYSYCITGHNFARNGIAVLERRLPVAHIAYEGSWNSAILPLASLDGTGQTEILTVTGGTNMGESWQIISMIELTDKGVRKFGQTNTYDEECNASSRSGKKTAYKLFAKSSAPPVFYRETYESDCSGKEAWFKIGPMEAIALEEDGIAYSLLPTRSQSMR